MGPEELRARAAEITWHHRIDLGQGVVTPGRSQTPLPAGDALPDVAGRTVLDIGAWDGAYSFWAEQAGAARVVALDDYVWGVDFSARNAYWQECRVRGSLPDHGRDRTHFWDSSLPGKAGFDLARTALGSRVEARVSDFMDCDLDDLGTFDVVLYLGVLYHMPEPLTALRRLRQVTGQLAVIETAAVRVPGHEQASLVWFLPGDELAGDFGNWFACSLPALHGLCLAAGFGRVVTKVGQPVAGGQEAGGQEAGGQEADGAPLQGYRALVHALVDP